MAAEENNGLSYLQALKEGEAPDPANPAEPPAETSEPAKPTLVYGTHEHVSSEQRRSPRYKCEGSAEIREEGREVGTWAAFSDISLYGCYIEAMATLPVGTLLDMKLEAQGLRIQAKAAVRVNYPYLGMGISFTEMSEGDRACLKELLRSLSQPSVILSGVAPATLPMMRQKEAVPVIIDSAAAVRVIVEFFERHSMLTRDEFFQLLHKSQAENSHRMTSSYR